MHISPVDSLLRVVWEESPHDMILSVDCICAGDHPTFCNTVWLVINSMKQALLTYIWNVEDKAMQILHWLPFCYFIRDCALNRALIFVSSGWHSLGLITAKQLFSGYPGTKGQTHMKGLRVKLKQTVSRNTSFNNKNTEHTGVDLSLYNGKKWLHGLESVMTRWPQEPFHGRIHLLGQ